MKEYIERKAATVYAPLPKHQREYTTLNLDDAWEDGYDYALSQVKSIPAADVRENVEATVIVDKNDNEICSNCGCHLLTMYTVHNALVLHPNFCPNCGADMRQKEET